MSLSSRSGLSGSQECDTTDLTKKIVVLAHDLARRGHIRDRGGHHVNGMHVKVVLLLDDVLHATTIVGHNEKGAAIIRREFAKPL